MTPARWDRIEELLSGTLKVSASEREEFLRTECGEDEDLVREVLSLADAHGRADLEVPGLDAVRSVLGALESEYYLGRMLGRYRIEEFLGRGGVGLVYRARDTEADRTVALKIFLPRSLSNPANRRRLETECRAVAALDHPNVVKVFELANVDEVQFLAMEYIGGETLAQRIRSGPLTRNEVVRIAGQIAEGLSAAHQAGIVHRDIKPANLMIDGTGTVKIVDFGLCRWSPPDREGAQDTVTLTEKHLIRGTVAYLSPELIEGKRPDARSDLFSFGAVLHEMVTGKRAFSAPTAAATLGAILHTQPAALRSIPVELRALVARCLEKDPERRFPSAAALLNAVRALKTPSRFGGWFDEVRRAIPRVAGYAAAGTVLAIAAGFVWSSVFVSRSLPPRLAPVTDDAGFAGQPDLSPDGKFVAYAANQAGRPGLDIWIQPTPAGAPKRLTFHEADDLFPSFSPDGKWILFTSDRDGGGIYRVPAGGGVEERLGPAGFSPRFSPDGRWIVYYSGPKGPRDRGPYFPRKLFLIDGAGGSPQPFHPEFAGAHTPRWSPDSRHLVFSGHLTGNDDYSLWIAKLDGSKPVPVTGPYPERAGGHSFRQKAMLPQCWLPGGRLVFQYAQGGRITFMEAPISLQRARFTGAPKRIVVGTDWQVNPACGPDGELVYASVQSALGIWSVALNGSRVERATVHSPAAEFFPSLTSDGRNLLFVSWNERRTIARRRWLLSGDERELADSKGLGLWVRQSPDGSRIAWSDDVDQQGNLSITDANGMPVKGFANVTRPWDVSPDTEFVLAQGQRDPAAIAVHRSGSLGAKPLLSHPSMDLRHAHFSPDRRWIAFSAQEGEWPPRTFIAPFQGEREIPREAWFPATALSGSNAEWSPAGDWLYFLSEDDGSLCLWGQRLHRTSKRPVGDARAIRHFHHTAFSLEDVSPNRRALTVARDTIALSVASQRGGIWLVQ
ncbi:MAG: protein kinase domain-containing protein [Bryobacteraceae bacterium]